MNEVLISTSGLPVSTYWHAHDHHVCMIIGEQSSHPCMKSHHTKDYSRRRVSCISNVLGRIYELWLLLSVHLDMQQEMSRRLPSSYHSVFANSWVNSECLHDKCDHLMSLRLIKRLSHLTGDGENGMKKARKTNSLSRVLWKCVDLSASLADVKDIILFPSFTGHCHMIRGKKRPHSWHFMWLRETFLMEQESSSYDSFGYNLLRQ